jgi:hypothetical protein
MQTEYSQCKTPAQRKALAEKIAKLRADGAKYDGPDGIVAKGIVASATQARALLRSVATSTAPLVPGRGTEGAKLRIGRTTALVAPSYVRDAEFRAGESARRLAKNAPAETPEPKRARKPRKAKATAE